MTTTFDMAGGRLSVVMMMTDDRELPHFIAEVGRPTSLALVICVTRIALSL